MDPGALLKGRTRETAIRRDARGHWFNGDDAITHPRLIEALDSWIDRAEDGRYCLKNDINWAYFELEGSPYTVRRVRSDGADLQLLLSGGLREPLRPVTLCIDDEGHLHCQVRGNLDARFSSQAQFDLGNHLVSDDPVIFEIGGERFEPSKCAEARKRP